VDCWKDKLKLRLPSIILLAVTLLFWGFYDRYTAAGPVLLEAPVLADGFRAHGSCIQSNGVFTLTVSEDGKTAGVRFKLEDAADYSIIRLSGRIRTIDVVCGKHAWNSARLLLIQRDAAGKWIPGSHRLLSKDGTEPWTGQVQEFKIDPKTVSVEVVLEQTGTSGIAYFSGIKAQPVKIRGSFALFRILFSLLWLGMAMLYFKRCRLDRRKLRLLILLNVIAILCGTLMPAAWIQTVSDQVKTRIEQSVRKKAEKKKAMSPAVQSTPSHPNRTPTSAPAKSAEDKQLDRFNEMVGSAHRAGHFILFMSLCFLVYCSAWREKQHPVFYVKVGLDVLLFAAVTESLQHLTMDRTPGVSDWLTDVYGMLLALGIFLCFRLIIHFLPRSGKA
jgi:VanZ family protein